MLNLLEYLFIDLIDRIMIKANANAKYNVINSHTYGGTQSSM